MKDQILQTVKQFLQGRVTSQKPLVLGFSGGPDSLALLHLLLECRSFLPFDLQVAHVDHGWRSNSSQEADKLREFVEKLNISFHLHRLKEGCQGEEAARIARLTFFRSLCPQAVLLGHQADDQSETVLKRLLEGASLMSLGGIRPISIWEGMPLWRPLLTISKADLQAWLKIRGLKPLEDPTNSDPRFLRSRMRTEIFPDLAHKFGKEVSSNLCRLGNAAQEIEEYLERKIAPYWKEVRGNTVDLRSLAPFEKLELKTFLKLWLKRQETTISHTALESLVAILEEGCGRKKISCGKGFIEVLGRSVEIKI